MIAIIGAGGFVGTRLTESLVLSGHRGIRPVVRGYKNFAGLCRFGSLVDVHRADAEDAESLERALDGCRVAVNLTTGPPAGIVQSTQSVHEACRRAGVARLVHLSSAVVYGDVPEPLDDDAPPLQKHWMPYARAKAASEVWLRQRLHAKGPEIVLLRPGIVWGVRSPHTSGFVYSLCQKSAYLVGDGHGIFNGIYIDNLVAAILASSEATLGASGFYNVGDAETVSWREFFEALGAPLGCDVARLPRVSADHFPRSLRSTVDAIQSLAPVNVLYHLLKRHLPDEMKAAIKTKLAGSYSFARLATEYAERPAVDRELWHLQRVRHKLSTDKFNQTFAFAPPVSFAEGIRKTLAWLKTIGISPSSLAHRPDDAELQANTSRR